MQAFVCVNSGSAPDPLKDKATKEHVLGAITVSASERNSRHNVHPSLQCSRLSFSETT